MNVLDILNECGAVQDDAYWKLNEAAVEQFVVLLESARIQSRVDAAVDRMLTAPKDGTKLWLWKNGDHFLAFTHLYPCFAPGGDPMTLGEPSAQAIFKVSYDRTE